MSSVEQELLAVVRDWDEAIAQNDADAIGQFIADDWIIIGSDGTCSDKETFLDLIRTGVLSHDVMRSADISIRIYGEAALITARGVSGGTYQGRPFHELERQSNMFVRQHSQWRCVITHLSRLASTTASDDMTKPAITGIAPFFIVKNVPAALSFYRDRLGFDITFQGPDPDDIFFGIVQRGEAMIMLKDVGVDPLPNYKRDVKKGWARWDAYLHVPDPDALAAEFSSRNVELSQPLTDDDDGLRGFALKDADGYVLFFGRPSS